MGDPLLDFVEIQKFLNWKQATIVAWSRMEGG
jgi:hypothetical protein